MHKEVKNSRRRYQRCTYGERKINLREIYVRKRRRFKEEIKKAKKLSWKRFVAENINENPFGFVYKFATQKLKMQVVNNSLNNEGRHTNSISKTMDVLLEAMLPEDEVDTETNYHANTREIQGQHYEEGKEPYFTDTELQNALKGIKKGRAPGPDQVPPDLVKVMTPDLRKEVLRLYNKCWENGYFPKEWKLAKLFVLYKVGGKDKQESNSYRPISLLPVLGKLLERLVGARLTQHLEKNNKFSSSQYGFRRGKDTTQAIQQVVSFARVSTRKHVIFVCLDIVGAFDGMWWPEILRQLRQAGVSWNAYKLIESYSSERQATIHYGGITKTREITKGCPQGSVLGPTLWNVCYNQVLTQEYPQGVKVIAFADDTAVLFEGDSMRELQESFKVVMDRIEQWASKVKLRFSVPKTKAIVLKGPITRRRYPTLKLYNRTIGFVEELKYLGVIIDRKLTFLPHAKSLATKSKTIFHNITKVARLNYGTKAQVMAKIYKAVYEPIMSYAAPVWAHRTQNTHL